MEKYQITYRINEPTDTQSQRSITCLVCNMTSYNSNDIANLYCGCCHQFHNIGVNGFLDKHAQPTQ